MKRMNLSPVLLKYLVAGMVFLMPMPALSAACQQPNWVPIVNTQYNMVAFGNLYVNGAKVTNANYTIGAFGPGGEGDCRAVGDTAANGSYYLTIVGDTNAQAITFKVYEKTTCKIYNITETATFNDSSVTMEGTDLHAASTQCDISGTATINIAGYTALPVKNATASLQNTAYSTAVDANGKFTLPGIPLGAYNLLVTAPGMASIIQSVTCAGLPLAVTLPPMMPSAAVCMNGDANGDGRLGVEDGVYILQMLTGLRK